MQDYPTCAFPGCLNGGRKKKGLCSTHYGQSRTGKPLFEINTSQRRRGSPPRIICDEVMCPVPGLIGPCHVFRGGKSDGYGVIGLGGSANMGQVHKYILEKENGPVPDGLVLDHQCRVRACCNTDHLRVVTVKVNVTENIVGVNWQLQAAKTHCLQGHPFDEANTYRYVTDGRTSRHCRECSRLSMQKRRLKLKGIAP